MIVLFVCPGLFGKVVIGRNASYVNYRIRTHWQSRKCYLVTVEAKGHWFRLRIIGVTVAVIVLLIESSIGVPVQVWRGTGTQAPMQVQMQVQEQVQVQMQVHTQTQARSQALPQQGTAEVGKVGLAMGCAGWGGAVLGWGTRGWTWWV